LTRLATSKTNLLVHTPHHHIARLTLALALILWACVLGTPSALAQGDEPALPGRATQPARDAQPAEDVDPDGVRTQRAQKVPAREVNRRVREYVNSSEDKITIHQIVQEMVDDFLADTRDLQIAAVSPLAIRSVGLSPNLSGAFGQFVEAELSNAMAKHSDIRVKRCIACGSLRTLVDGDDLVVALGQVDQAELAAIAKEIGVVAFADAFVSYVPGANVVSMNVQIYRASDGKILWSETYQSDATTAAILRSGDRVLTRDEARAELVRKIEQRPYYGYQVLAGAGYIPFTPGVPGQNAGLPGFLVGGRIYEKFGADKRLLYGFHGEFFGNFDPVNGIAGGFVGAAFQYQLNDPNLNDPTIRVGGAALGFLAGQEGNTFALEATADVVLQFRFGLSVAAFYMLPVDFAGGTLGGPGAKARFLINW
jgi:hypothetical protein